MESSRNKNPTFYFGNSLKSKPILLIFIYFVIFFCNVVVSEECKQITNCKCRFNNGSVIDLTSLGYSHEARFKNVTPIAGNTNFTYYYNPCSPFTLGDCKNVAVCQVNKTGTEFHDCGSDKNGFVWNAETNHLNLLYSSASNDDQRFTNVTLVCSSEATTPTLVVNGENPMLHYLMTLTSRCACPDLCAEEHHLSPGSVLVILFMIFVSLYLVLGIVHSSLTRGAHGWELIPHYEFWSDFPLLVRDGCVFVMSGCKAETAYERI